MHPAQHDPQSAPPQPHLPTYRYRAAIERRAPLEPVADPALLEHITVHSTDAVTAARSIAAVTGAAVVHTPERLDEVSAQLRYLTRRACPRCKRPEYTATCSACGTFKFPAIAVPFADELGGDELRAA